MATPSPNGCARPRRGRSRWRRERCTPRCTAWNIASGSPRNGGSPRTTAGRSSTASRRSAGGCFRNGRGDGTASWSPWDGCSTRSPRTADRMTHDEPKWRRYLRLARPNPVADLDDELRDHIESATEGLVARGMSTDAARAEALRRFGDVGRVRGEVQRLDEEHMKETSRAARLETFVYDLRHGARALRRSPCFAFVAAISIALGVAAN